MLVSLACFGGAVLSGVTLRPNTAEKKSNQKPKHISHFFCNCFGLGSEKFSAAVIGNKRKTDSSFVPTKVAELAIPENASPHQMQQTDIVFFFFEVENIEK
jgi:hypothetical protein